MTEPSLTRRTLMKGAAWSIPVIAVAASAPLAAASQQACDQLRFIGTPKFGQHDLKFKIQNKCSETAINVNVLLAYNGGTRTYAMGDIAPNGLSEVDHTRDTTIPAGPATLTIISDNMAGETISVTLG